MRRLCVFLAAGALLLGISGSASAGSFASGTLGITIGALPAIALPSGAPGAFSISAGGGAVEPVGVFGPATIPLPRALFTGVPQISGLTLVGFGNGTKNIALPTATGGLAGSAYVNVLGLLNLSIPLGVVGGAASGTAKVTAGGIIITAHGQPWTTGAQAVTGITTTISNVVLNTLTYTGSQMGTLSGNATVTLVSAFKAITNVAGNLPGLAFQTLRFVPEPGTLLLLGSGVVGLLVVGRRKMMK